MLLFFFFQFCCHLSDYVMASSGCYKKYLFYVSHSYNFGVTGYDNHVRLCPDQHTSEPLAKLSFSFFSLY